MDSGFRLVSEAELEKYRAVLDWYGYAEDDFEITERLDPPDQGDTTPTTGFICITRKSAAITRYYRLSGMSPWTEDFDHDVRRGVFKAH